MQKCRSNVVDAQKLEIAVLLRTDGGGPPVALATLNDPELLRAVLQKMVATLSIGAARASDPLKSRACFAQVRTLREYLNRIE
jgi:hypothetical protein